MVAVYIADDMGDDWEPGPPLVSPPPTLEDIVFHSRTQVPLVKDKVRHAGEPIAGGLRWPEAVDLPDDVIADQVRADLDRILGLQGDPEILTVTRQPRAVAQPDRDHVRRVGRIRAHLAGEAGLALAGSYLAGVSVPDSFASGVAAARQILAAEGEVSWEI